MSSYYVQLLWALFWEVITISYYKHFTWQSLRAVIMSSYCEQLFWAVIMNSYYEQLLVTLVSRWRTMHPQSPALTIGWTVLEESDDLVTLGLYQAVIIVFDYKMIFEKHLLSVSRAASLRLGILRKSWLVFHDRLLSGRCFRGFVLPVLECRSAVWCSAADTNI